MNSPATPHQDSNPGRTRFVLLTLLLVLCCNFTSSLFGWGWRSATIITFSISALYVVYTWRYRDNFLARILLFSLAAGWTELVADWWLVDVTGTLMYQPGGLFVWCSPLYMPFAWTVVTTQLGYIGWWLGRRYGLIAASLLTGLIGAVNIPLYEQWARNADWWQYQNTTMLGYTPWYIIGGEFLIAFSLPAAMAVVERQRWQVAGIAGVMQGLWIWVAYRVAFRLFP